MLTADEALEKRWYYTAELKPGKYTNGFAFKNISVTRRVLEALDVDGSSMLDVSTMEGMFSILAARRGAQVTATDSINLYEQVSLLKDVYDAKFDYHPHSPVQGFADHVFSLQSSKSFSPRKPLRQLAASPFGYDLVLSSGVIYHVLNPIDHLISYRKLTKLGGLCVIESAVLLSDRIEMVHDWQDDVQTFGGNATWFTSTKALEVFLRAAFFEPLGFAYVRSVGHGHYNLARIAVVARAVDTRSFSEEAMGVIKGSELFKNYDFKPLYPAAQLTGNAINPPKYDASLLHDASDLRGSTIEALEEVQFDPSYLTLSLADR